jgi:Protein of unknown function (DUF3499)
VAHQCERPACAEPAAVAYGFDPSRGVAWLEVFVATDPHHGRLCRRHAEAMVVPQGWWLEDRRSAEQLFTSPATDGGSERPLRRPGRSRRPAVVIDLPLPPPAPAADVGVAAVDGASLPPPLPLVAVPAWTPTFVADDDLGGVLNATSPLLSRAFGRVKGSGTRARPPT